MCIYIYIYMYMYMYIYMYMYVYIFDQLPEPQRKPLGRPSNWRPRESWTSLVQQSWTFHDHFRK